VQASSAVAAAVCQNIGGGNFATPWTRAVARKSSI